LLSGGLGEKQCEEKGDSQPAEATAKARSKEIGKAAHEDLQSDPRNAKEKEEEGQQRGGNGVEPTRS
jgi:hypothetical protein